MQKSKTLKSKYRKSSLQHVIEQPEKLDSDGVDIDSIEYVNVEWENLERHNIELDPTLVEEIRAKRTLKQITLRVGIEQIKEARWIAEKTKFPYQTILRRWLAQGASIARTKRKQLKTLSKIESKKKKNIG